MWGITASDSRKGYVAWGGPPREGPIDGSVVPSAAAGSLMFAPDITLPAVREMRERFGDRIYGRYGFADAFHPGRRLGESGRDRDRRRHHAAQRREPAHGARLAMVHEERGDSGGDGASWPGGYAPACPTPRLGPHPGESMPTVF